ncbi:unnamed protein product [Cladocopium goreaui]|uniref:Rhodanese domain-containing protein n=1 Tax=Cladocopium goreaui TaxID=2562237 RepID=A0A9P1BZJ2_9DINO|nr:unnamed protein product [Cladocopium goreaui]
MVDKATAEVLKGLEDPLVIDVRDPNEVAEGKGGPPSVIPGSVNVPLNVDGKKQSDYPTSPEEFQAKLSAAGVTLPPKEKAIITHCGTGGRGGKACEILRGLGYSNCHNGGGPAHIASARGIA